MLEAPKAENGESSLTENLHCKQESTEISSFDATSLSSKY